MEEEDKCHVERRRLKSGGKLPHLIHSSDRIKKGEKREKEEKEGKESSRKRRRGRMKGREKKREFFSCVLTVETRRFKY